MRGKHNLFLKKFMNSVNGHSRITENQATLGLLHQKKIISQARFSLCATRKYTCSIVSTVIVGDSISMISGSFIYFWQISLTSTGIVAENNRVILSLGSSLIILTTIYKAHVKFCRLHQALRANVLGYEISLADMIKDSSRSA